MAKQKYYSNSKIKELGCQYNILLGERANGKSYSVKDSSLRDAYNGMGTLIYLRRWQLETKTVDVMRYFADCDIRGITDGKYSKVICYRSELYFGNVDDDGKDVRGLKCGDVMNLSGATHYKSQSFPNTLNVIFEEFITKDLYLDNEPYELMELISTIARRRQIYVWLIGNTISRQCPYFSCWSLDKVLKQKQGTIDVYNWYTNQLDENGKDITIRIAVEYCESTGYTNKMFFGKKADSITTGVWESQEHPKLYTDSKHFTMNYELMVKYLDISYVLQLLTNNDTGEPVVYVYPYTKNRRINRVIQQDFNASFNVSNKLLDRIAPERVIRDLIKLNKICYSDNLTGTEFNNMLKSFDIL